MMIKQKVLLISNSKKKKRFIIVGAVILVVLSVCCALFFINQDAKKKKEEERIATEKNKKEEEEYIKEHNDYVNSMNECYNAAQEMNAKIQELSSLITRVWYNSIFEEKDKDTDKYTIKNGKFLSFEDSVNKCIEKEISKKNFQKVGNDFADKYVEITKIEIPERDKPKYNEYDGFVREYAKLIYDFWNSAVYISGNYSEFSEKQEEQKQKISEKQTEILSLIGSNKVPEIIN